MISLQLPIILASLILSTSSQDIFNSGRVPCPSVPKSVQNLFPFLVGNTTNSCSSCTSHGYCSWCNKGKVTHILVYGETLPDIEIANFCWYGNPFQLQNNTYTDGQSSFETAFWIECDTIPNWKQVSFSKFTITLQCSIDGSIAVGIFLSGCFIMLVTFICIFCCLACGRCSRKKFEGETPNYTPIYSGD